jgi:hypothetical protein
MPEIRPDALDDRLNALCGHAGVEEITLDPESFERYGLIAECTALESRSP